MNRKIKETNLKYQSLAAGFVTISFLWSSPVIAAGFSKIYAFGDSLSDTGNISAITGIDFPPPPYFEGRFSNGPVWVEVLAEKLGVEVENFAVGGATTGDRNTSDNILPQLPGLEQQIDNFVTVTNSMAESDALYTIWAGADDYLPTENPTFMPFDTPDVTLSNIQTAIDDLIGVGAKKLMVLNLPSLGKVPRTSSSLDGICPPDEQFDADCLNDLTIAHNNGLSSLSNALSTEVEITLVDVNSLFDRALANPELFGFTNVTEACLKTSVPSICSNQDEYLFWDFIHPNSQGHRLVGELAFQALTVPEPTSILGLLALGTFGVSTIILGKK